MAKKKKNPLGWKGQMILVCSIVMAVVFLPTTILLVVGMLPTLVAALVDRTRERVLGMTVGSMNLAGCTPFVIELWSGEHTPERALEIVAQPLPITIMFAAAALGYMIEWSMTGIVASIMSQKAIARLKAIDEQQKKLIDRWGREVSGEIPLDPYGFPLGQAEEDDAPEG
jgi:hypothetical protein